MPRGHVQAPGGHLARARARQPRVHRARRLLPEGEDAGANTRRAAGPKPCAGVGGFAGDQKATAATTGRALHGRRAARVQCASHGAQGGHALRLPARWGHVWPRARAATAAGARFHDRRWCRPTHDGDPIVAHPSTSVRALGRFRGRARRADGRTGCAWTARGARCARGRQKMPDYWPAGAFFFTEPAGQYEEDEIEKREGAA